jgi:hypothetical protein
VVYSPGYEEQQVQFSQELSFGWVPFAEPILCIRSIGGPFEFNIDISPIEDADWEPSDPHEQGQGET